MRQTVVTVEALRCHECQALIDPVEGEYFQRQGKTAVEVGHRYGPIERYELVNVCPNCHQRLEQRAAEERQRKWWFRVWCAGVIANIVVSALFPVGWLPLYGWLLLSAAIIWRNVWKWQAKRQQQIEPGQADRRKVPQAAATNDAATELTKSGSS